MGSLSGIFGSGKSSLSGFIGPQPEAAQTKNDSGNDSSGGFDIFGGMKNFFGGLNEPPGGRTLVLLSQMVTAGGAVSANKLYADMGFTAGQWDVYRLHCCSDCNLAASMILLVVLAGIMMGATS